jgi:hypothetical protein
MSVTTDSHWSKRGRSRWTEKSRLIRDIRGAATVSKRKGVKVTLATMRATEDDMTDKIGPKEQAARELREEQSARALREASIKEQQARLLREASVKDRVGDAVNKMKAKGVYKVKTFKVARRGG